MIIAVIGAGGKTTHIHRLAKYYRSLGKKVLVTTSTHMYIEPDTLLTEDTEIIREQLEKTGYVMAGIPEGKKIRALSAEAYTCVCEYADVVLIEADGSRGMPLKYPNQSEPVIYENVDQIHIICGLQALGRPAGEVVQRLELAEKIMDLPENKVITPTDIQRLVQKGYIEKMKEKYPDKEIYICPSHDGSLYQRALAALLSAKMDVSLIKEEWFKEKPCLFICGGGHVAKELAEFAEKLDFRVKVMDDREDFANEERFPMAEKLICDSFEHLDRYLEPDSFYVVVTRGHRDDRLCVKQILDTSYRYLGMIGSKIKVTKTFELLKEEGVTDAEIASIHAPIGLKIGAATPAEIAVSILAEIIQEKNKESNSSISAELLKSEQRGMLCIIIEKTGSSPRSVGSMMLVTEDQILDSVGGGAVEFAVIEDARAERKAAIRDYNLNNTDSGRLGMICGGSNRILFLPV